MLTNISAGNDDIDLTRVARLLVPCQLIDCEVLLDCWREPSNPSSAVLPHANYDLQHNPQLTFPLARRSAPIPCFPSLISQNNSPAMRLGSRARAMSKKILKLKHHVCNDQALRIESRL